MSESAVQEHQASELIRCATDPYYFILTYCKFFDPQGGGILTPERLNHQELLLQAIRKYGWVIILKPRQVGVTWTTSALSVHDTIFVPGANDLIFSRGEKEAAKTLRERCRFIWANLPPFLQLPLGTDNNETLQFVIDKRTDEYSYIRSFPSKPGAGVGETATRVVLDEWSKIDPSSYAEQIYIDVAPTVSKGSLVMMSTAEGAGHFFARTYFDAQKGLNDLTPIFIPYRQGDMPGRDAEWEARERRRYPGFYFNQNYPTRIADAFLMSGTCMFDINVLKSLVVSPPQAELFGAQIYELPNTEHTYHAGVDTALGASGRDFSCCQIICATCGHQAARLHSQLPIEEFSEAAASLLAYYNRPSVIPESQPLGPLFVKVLTDNGYPSHRIYHRTKNQTCWHTTQANRKQILGELEQGIREGVLRPNNQETIDEFLGFGYNEQHDKFEAMTGHDDEVMSMALAWHSAINAPVNNTDYTPRSYVGPTNSRLETILDTNWRKKDPFKNRETIPCPDCNGDKMVPNPHTLQDDVCRICHGVGRMLRVTSR